MAQRYVREVTGQDNALRLHASLGFCRLVDGDEFVALGFQVVDDGGQRVHVYQPKPAQTSPFKSASSHHLGGLQIAAHPVVQPDHRLAQHQSQQQRRNQEQGEIHHVKQVLIAVRSGHRGVHGIDGVREW